MVVPSYGIKKRTGLTFQQRTHNPSYSNCHSLRLGTVLSTFSQLFYYKHLDLKCYQGLKFEKLENMICCWPAYVELSYIGLCSIICCAVFLCCAIVYVGCMFGSMIVCVVQCCVILLCFCAVLCYRFGACVERLCHVLCSVALLNCACGSDGWAVRESGY